MHLKLWLVGNLQLKSLRGIKMSPLRWAHSVVGTSGAEALAWQGRALRLRRQWGWGVALGADPPAQPAARPTLPSVARVFSSFFPTPHHLLRGRSCGGQNEWMMVIALIRWAWPFLKPGERPSPGAGSPPKGGSTPGSTLAAPRDAPGHPQHHRWGRAGSLSSTTSEP